MDEYGKGLMATCAAPVYDRERFLGPVAVDLTVDLFNAKIRGFRTEKGAMFLVNDRDQLLAQLLLMELDPDSPLREPILTIQKSGERAAAIVQDLLPLARRGVAVTEVVNLNVLASDYLGSAESRAMCLHHPGVEVVTDPEASLLNTEGSPVHLSECLMNLVTNAAEAMPQGGTVLISTGNQYIDQPVTGYDEVKEGD